MDKNMNQPKPSSNIDELDLANFTALVMREMHWPIKEGKFMAGGKTPHQYLTAELAKYFLSIAEGIIDGAAEKAPVDGIAYGLYKARFYLLADLRRAFQKAFNQGDK